ncbi:MAG: hypothetical protein EOS11_04920 [Mesorhizobium sp.]|nr:MAG: hypothetical protein EOS11_04920 [Mesorhizobium sp.]
MGPVSVKRAKLRNRATEGLGEDRITFTSAILPKWARRTKSLNATASLVFFCPDRPFTAAERKGQLRLAAFYAATARLGP